MRSAQLHVRFREKALQAAIHEMRNHLSVAMASIEAFLDGKLEPSDFRLHAMFETLREIDLLIDDLPRNGTVAFDTHVVSIDVCRLVAGHVAAMEGFAAERGVRLTIESCEGTHPECVLRRRAAKSTSTAAAVRPICALPFQTKGRESGVRSGRTSSNAAIVGHRLRPLLEVASVSPS
jgi:hypothetical protein